MCLVLKIDFFMNVFFVLLLQIKLCIAGWLVGCRVAAAVRGEVSKVVGIWCVHGYAVCEREPNEDDFFVVFPVNFMFHMALCCIFTFLSDVCAGIAGDSAHCK